MGKTIILIHGGGPKPDRDTLVKIWTDGLRHAIERDHPRKLARFDKCTIDMVYYADVVMEQLAEDPRYLDYDAAADTKDRNLALYRTKELKRDDFARAELYDNLPGKNAFKEALADALGGVLSAFRISELVIADLAPDVKKYWDTETDFGSRVRWPAIGAFVKAFERGDDICVIGHSLGSLLAWDMFWKMSHTGEYRPRYANTKIDLFLSLGSPLGDDTVQRHLKGAEANGPRRYPVNLSRWVNVAAEDDYVAHDQSVADDYAEMLEWGAIESIEDHRVYNLSVRGGRSNPHHVAGYLVHPVVGDVISGWV